MQRIVALLYSLLQCEISVLTFHIQFLFSIAVTVRTFFLDFDASAELQRLNSVLQGVFLPPTQAVGVNARGSSDQIFQITVMSEYVSKFGCDLFSDLRDKVWKKEERKKKP